MKNIRGIALLIFFIIFCIYSCKTEEKVKKLKAELTFKSISFASAYGASQEQYENYLKQIDEAINNSPESNNEMIKLYRHHSRLKYHNLLKSPYIFLRIDKDSIMTVYLSEKEYKKVKSIKHIDLKREGKKAIIELDITKKDSGIYYSNNIINISRVKGISRSNI